MHTTTVIVDEISTADLQLVMDVLRRTLDESDGIPVQLTSLVGKVRRVYPSASFRIVRTALGILLMRGEASGLVWEVPFGGGRVDRFGDRRPAYCWRPSEEGVR
ncbi:hypothetical protein [Prescottella equi]|uniref:hypothetical protein n=1 Tax=Rhodococcus hoagii TaxID=43767 RepID=UPI00111BD20E|nr:hypothetical protein [Prescottella equi]